MKTPLRHIICCLGLLLGASPLARAETLSDAVGAAITTHPSVMAAQESEAASAQTVREQRSGYFPDITANATGGRIYGDNATSRGLSVTRGAGYSGLGEGSVSLSQKVFDWGETGDRVDAAKARLEAAQDTTVGTRDQLALRASQAFMALLRAGELKGGAAENLKAIKSYRDKIKVQVDAGGSDEAELNRANDFLLLAQNAATEFDGQYNQAMADYMEAVGDAPQTALVRPMLPAALPESLEAAIDYANTAHPEVLAAKQALIASDRDMQAEATNFLPKVRGELSYLKRDQADIIGGEAVDARAVMKMDWNYALGGAQHARVKRAVHTRAQTKAQLQETYRRVARDIRVAWAALDVARRQEKTQADRRTATANVVDTYKKQYEGDKRTLIELMQAESQAFDAKVAYANADYGVLNATYALLAATGQLLPAVQPVEAEAVDEVGAVPVQTVTAEPVDQPAGASIVSDDRQ